MLGVLVLFLLCATVNGTAQHPRSPGCLVRFRWYWSARAWSSYNKSGGRGWRWVVLLRQVKWSGLALVVPVVLVRSCLVFL